MVIKDLERPIKWQKLSDWACTQFIEIKQHNPHLTEKEIAMTIFSSEYKKPYVPSDIKELAHKNLNSIESVPDLLLAMLNMEAEGGRDTQRLNAIFLSAIMYSLKTYQDKLYGNTQFDRIIIIIGLIARHVDLKISDPEKRSNIRYLLVEVLICMGLYKEYETYEEINNAIIKMLNEL
jgi:hypothetical protein